MQTFTFIGRVLEFWETILLVVNIKFSMSDYVLQNKDLMQVEK